MLSESQRDHLTVVLVHPRNPLNIGAAARALANFGFAHLLVVSPYEPHWREAKSAVGAPDQLQNAKVTESLAQAIADSTLVLGTGTLTHRKPEQPVVQLPDLGPRVAAELASGGRVSLVFGPEKHGLTREDLSYCHFLVEIPTDSRQPSMNLGQAVAVCLYELAVRPASPNPASLPTNLECTPATSGHLDLLADVVEQTMLGAGYSPRSMESANRHDLRVLLRRLALTPQDLRRVLGLFRRILWRLHTSPDSPHNRD